MSTQDRVPFHHEALAPLTVGELRKALVGVPDEVTVRVMVNSEPWTGTSTGGPAQTAEFRVAGGVVMGGGPTFTVYGGPPSGTYLRPRPGTLVVEHGEAQDEATHALIERLKQAVHDAAVATGNRGEKNGSFSETVATWTFESAGSVDVTEVVAAAEAAAAALNPGTWRVEAQVA